MKSFPCRMLGVNGRDTNGSLGNFNSMIFQSQLGYLLIYECFQKTIDPKYRIRWKGKINVRLPARGNTLFRHLSSQTEVFLEANWSIKTRVNDWIRYKLNRKGNRMAMNGVLSLVIHFLICPSWQSHRRQTKTQFQFQFDCDIQIKREKHHLKSNIHSSPSHTMYQLCNPFRIKFSFSRV